MSWRFRLTFWAEQAFHALDASLQAELREQVAEIADDPLMFLQRAPMGLIEFPTLVFGYGSRVVPGLRINVFVDAELEPDIRIVTIVAIRDHMLDQDEVDS